MSNTFGALFRITTWGESHGKAIGVVLDGCPAGLKISEEDVQQELDKRAPGQSEIVSPRKESDKVEILSGIFEGKTTGMPISMIIYNKDADSSKYEKIKHLLRPGHADFTYQVKYGFRDYRGGGRSSARETAARVAAGAVAKKLLSRFNIIITAYVKEIAGIKANKADYKEIYKNNVRCPDKNAARKMEQAILKAKNEGDSVGGVCEVVALNVPAGLGKPIYNKLEADLGTAILGINAVKGVEFGAGFGLAKMKGSVSNDEFIIKNNKIATKTNNHGGILGGISTGMPIVMRAVVKPASSILKKQKTINYRTMKQETISVEGRHDPATIVRFPPIAEAMTAIVIADHMIMAGKISPDKLIK
ncbi:chorismate synthase [Candidatus Woesearchaeota archaeon]|nr:chorismate synthase [Candidatus Woesearchaeota archaeon]